MSNDNECLAFIADKCFDGFSSSILCLSSEVSSDTNRVVRCEENGSNQLCSSLVDALNCTRSFVESSCKLQTLNYGFWMKGLEAVHRLICLDNPSLINDIFESQACWNPEKFLSCTEGTVGVNHVTDLLNVQLDAAECNKVMVGIALCNAKAEKNRYRCKGVAEVILKSVIAFFAESSCMTKLTNELLKEYCSHEAMIQSLSAVTITLFVVGLLLIAIVSFLMRHNVLTVNKRFRLYNDEDTDTRTDDSCT